VDIVEWKQRTTPLETVCKPQPPPLFHSEEGTPLSAESSEQLGENGAAACRVSQTSSLLEMNERNWEAGWKWEGAAACYAVIFHPFLPFRCLCTCSLAMAINWIQSKDAERVGKVNRAPAPLVPPLPRRLGGRSAAHDTLASKAKHRPVAQRGRGRCWVVIVYFEYAHVQGKSHALN